MKLDSEGTGATIVGREAGGIGGFLSRFFPIWGNFWIEGNDNIINSTETIGHWYVALCVY